MTYLVPCIYSIVVEKKKVSGYEERLNGKWLKGRTGL